MRSITKSFRKDSRPLALQEERLREGISLSVTSKIIVGGQPMVAALLAWWVIGEEPGLRVVIGGAIVLFVAAYESFKRNKTVRE
ncbi:MAG: hypothetical protein P8Y84_11060 [Desulfuromonadales bacterium]